MVVEGWCDPECHHDIRHGQSLVLILCLLNVFVRNIEVSKVGEGLRARRNRTKMVHFPPETGAGRKTGTFFSGTTGTPTAFSASGRCEAATTNQMANMSAASPRVCLVPVHIRFFFH